MKETLGNCCCCPHPNDAAGEAPTAFGRREQIVASWSDRAIELQLSLSARSINFSIRHPRQWRHADNSVQVVLR